MNLIDASFKIVEQAPGLEGMYKQIELAGRTCYKSEDRITKDSAKGFVERMIASGHGAMLEHGTVYLTIPGEHEPDEWGRTYPFINYKGDYRYNKYSKVVFEHYKQEPVGTQAELCKSISRSKMHITTNLRVLVENDWMDDLQYMCEPTEYHEKRVCVRYTSDIHFYKDTTRHRVFSWAIESTRFCNYIKEKFGSSVSFLMPIWLKDDERAEFEEDLKTIENIYFKWINKGWQPQQAAYFLIQGTKAEIFMTGFVSDYRHFFDLRSEIAKTGKPHPTVVELVEPLRQEFIKREYI